MRAKHEREREAMAAQVGKRKAREGDQGPDAHEDRDGLPCSEGVDVRQGQPGPGRKGSRPRRKRPAASGSPDLASLERRDRSSPICPDGPLWLSRPRGPSSVSEDEESVPWSE